MKAATHIEVAAEVRYWEDATVNGIPDDTGDLIPGKHGDVWKAKINLADGYVENWPIGTIADVHYKVCDAGEYWLLDDEGNRIAHREGYVPTSFLCHGGNGYGDYIIMKVGPDGMISDYTAPQIDPEEWEAVPAA